MMMFLLELVVDDLASVVLVAGRDDLVGDDGRVQEGNGLLAHVVHRQQDVARVDALQLLLGLVADAHNLGLKAVLLLGEEALNRLDNRRVNGTAQASV